MRAVLSPDRDVEKTRLAIEEWLADRMPDADGVTVAELEVPDGTGFSNETLLFDVSYREDGESQTNSMVARLQTPEPTIFPDLDVTKQARVMEAVAAHSDVPVPDVLWVEEDPTVLGTPFFVMEKIEGVIPTDMPSYNDTGFLTRVSVPERHALWESAIEKLARVHRVDVEDVGLGFLDQREDGEPGLDQHLSYLRRYYRWAVGDHPFPVAERAWEWIEHHRPADPGPVGLCWGDTRISNMIFAGTECVAVLDWEQVLLGPPERDLGWWLYFDRFSSEGYGVPRLEGLPGRQESITCYEGLLGRPVRDLEFYEVLAGFYFAVIMVRVGATLVRLGLLPGDATFGYENPSVDLLASVERALKLSQNSSAHRSQRDSAVRHIASLTPRQRQIMALVLAGQPSKNIAADLGISQRTVENHRAAIMKKTGARSLPALARLAISADAQGQVALRFEDHDRSSSLPAYSLP